MNGGERLMMNEGKNSQTQEQEEFLSVNVPDNHQSENASEKCGLVSVVYPNELARLNRQSLKSAAVAAVFPFSVYFHYRLEPF